MTNLERDGHCWLPVLRFIIRRYRSLTCRFVALYTETIAAELVLSQSDTLYVAQGMICGLDFLLAPTSRVSAKEEKRKEESDDANDSTYRINNLWMSIILNTATRWTDSSRLLGLLIGVDMDLTH